MVVGLTVVTAAVVVLVSAVVWEQPVNPLGQPLFSFLHCPYLLLHCPFPNMQKLQSVNLLAAVVVGLTVVTAEVVGLTVVTAVVPSHS